MRKRGILSRKTGEMEWFDEKGKPCDPPSDKLKPGDIPTLALGKRGWPFHCEASAVHPSQAQEFEKLMHDAGVPTTFRSDGCPKYENNAHRTRALKVRGMVDKDACYSQPAP